MVYTNVSSYMEVEDFGPVDTAVTGLLVFRKFLTASTVGSVGLNSYMCENTEFDKTYTFECLNGKLSSNRYMLGTPLT